MFEAEADPLARDPARPAGGFALAQPGLVDPRIPRGGQAAYPARAVRAAGGGGRRGRPQRPQAGRRRRSSPATSSIRRCCADLKARGFRCLLVRQPAGACPRPRRGRRRLRGDRRAGRADPRHGAVELSLIMPIRSTPASGPRRPSSPRLSGGASRCSPRRWRAGPMREDLEGARLDGLAGVRPHACCFALIASRGRRASPRGSIAGAGIAGPTRSRSRWFRSRLQAKHQRNLPGEQNRHGETRSRRAAALCVRQEHGRRHDRADRLARPGLAG